MMGKKYKHEHRGVIFYTWQNDQNQWEAEILFDNGIEEGRCFDSEENAIAHSEEHIDDNLPTVKPFRRRF